MEPRTEIRRVKVAENRFMNVEATVLGGEEDISFRLPEFREVMDSIEQIAATLSEMMKRVKPSKAAVEFGIEIAVESGGLTALLVKGTGKANLVIKLEWV
jgi:Trypsin-co-occurring domain 1